MPTEKIKQKVLKEDERISILRQLIKIEEKEQKGTKVTQDYVERLKDELRLLETCRGHYLAEVKKMLKDYKKDMKILKGDTELTFEEHIENINQKLGIK